MARMLSIVEMTIRSLEVADEVEKVVAEILRVLRLVLPRVPRLKMGGAAIRIRRRLALLLMETPALSAESGHLGTRLRKILLVLFLLERGRHGRPHLLRLAIPPVSERRAVSVSQRVSASPMRFSHRSKIPLHAR